MTEHHGAHPKAVHAHHETHESAEERKKEMTSRIILALILILILLPFTFHPALGLVAYPYTVSEGARVGQVVKVSKRGLVWKTWEGSLGVTQSGAYVEKWNFSVDPSGENADELVRQLQEAAETGRIVKINYKQHLGIRSWDGKTSFSVESIQVLSGSGYRTTIPRQLNSLTQDGF
jgi:hypothetical protein